VSSPISQTLIRDNDTAASLNSIVPDKLCEFPFDIVSFGLIK